MSDVAVEEFMSFLNYFWNWHKASVGAVSVCCQFIPSYALLSFWNKNYIEIASNQDGDLKTSYLRRRFKLIKVSILEFLMLLMKTSYFHSHMEQPSLYIVFQSVCPVQFSRTRKVLWVQGIPGPLCYMSSICF